MASLVVREEPLLKQLVRSRTLRSSARANSSSRSSSQPPPLSRGTASSSAAGGGSPGGGKEVLTTYTLQFLPYNVLYPKKNLPHSPQQVLSLSQPDLSKLYTQSPSIYSPPRTTTTTTNGGFMSRESSPIRGGSISSSLRSSLINLDSAAWPPSLASNSVLLPMTDAPLVNVPGQQQQVEKDGPQIGVPQSNGGGFCQMCYLLSKPPPKVRGGGETCDSCSLGPLPFKSILDNPAFCNVGSPKPPETTILVNGCDITNSVIGGGYRPNNHSNVLTNNSSLSGGEVRPSFPSQQHQQRIVRGGGPSRLTSRAVSPSKERPSSEGAHLLASFYSSASGTNQGAIDNRIEQAMDLVKSHLMNAVRSEVEELKERIVKLEDVISHLQNENDFLKANVSQEVLTQLPPTSHAHHQILSSAATQGNTQQPGGGLSPISTPLPSGNNTQQQQQQQPL